MSLASEIAFIKDKMSQIDAINRELARLTAERSELYTRKDEAIQRADDILRLIPVNTVIKVDGEFYTVVQQGHFRNVTPIKVVDGDSL